VGTVNGLGKHRGVNRCHLNIYPNTELLNHPLEKDISLDWLHYITEVYTMSFLTNGITVE